MRYKLILLIFFVFLFAGFHGIAQTPLKEETALSVARKPFAMIMGISKYKYVRPLAYADKDAQLFRDYLLSPGGGV
jgi:hypothetical protein